MIEIAMQARDKFFSALSDIRSASPVDPQQVDVIDVGSSLTGDSIEALQMKLVAKARAGSWRYVVDLGRVKAVDSSGLGSLVSVLRCVQDTGGFIALVTRSQKLQRMLELCARSRRCKIYSCGADAYRALYSATAPQTAA